MDWKEFQEITAQVFRQVGCSAEVDVPIQGVRFIHDIDVYVTFKNFGFEEKWIIECKFWKSNIPKEKVLALKSIVDDVGAHRGLIISEKGFQTGAINGSKNTNIELITLNELKKIIAQNIIPVKLLNFDKKVVSKPIAIEKVSIDILNNLKYPEKGDYAEIYKEYLLSTMCQKTQKSACIGLSKINSVDAVILLTERLTNFWGLDAIKSTIKALSKIPENGGILGLTVTLFWDYRTYYEKLMAISLALKKIDNSNYYEVVNQILETRVELGLDFSHQLAQKIPYEVSMLLKIDNLDVRHGLVVGHFYNQSLWANSVEVNGNIEESIEYIEKRIPELLNVIKSVNLLNTN